jgi:hypothetical protein
LATCVAASAAIAQDGTLQTIRDDVRQGPPASPSTPSQQSTPQQSGKGSGGTSDPASDDDGSWIIPAACLAGVVVASPFWGPHVLLDDDLSQSGYFLKFPYSGGSGYIRPFEVSGLSKPWAVRLDTEYVATFDRLDNLEGHLLVDSFSRFGLAASWNDLQERLPSGGRDELSIGDCNLVYRFAQSESAEFRTGLGLNWLNDRGGTDLGFNFTYAADFYPWKPWVVSTGIDWGMLGHAELFRFRLTTGLVRHGLEPYVGYEYTDIGRAHWNGLVGGLRLWF